MDVRSVRRLRRAALDAERRFATTSFSMAATPPISSSFMTPIRRDPTRVDAGMARFFAGLKDDPAAVADDASGPVLEQPDWPPARRWRTASPRSTATGAALESKRSAPRSRRRLREAAPHSHADDCSAPRAIRVRAIMMIRAYRMRGHLHANLDPLGLEQRQDHGELHPATYGFTEADYDRKIFIDGVLGLEYASVREMVAILRRTYCGTIGFEFMHISDPDGKGLAPGAHRRPRQGDRSSPRGQARDPATS